MPPHEKSHISIFYITLQEKVNCSFLLSDPHMMNAATITLTCSIFRQKKPTKQSHSFRALPLSRRGTSAQPVS